MTSQSQRRLAISVSDIPSSSRLQLGVRWQGFLNRQIPWKMACQRYLVFAASEVERSSIFSRADFVERSRPQAPLNYMTIGTADPGRATAPRTVAEVKAAEAELDAERDRNMARGTAAANLGGTPPPPPVVAPAPAKKPSPKRP